MINKQFIFTTHSLESWEERFNELSKEEELNNISYCTNSEVIELKSTPSYRKIKKGKRQHFHFYKSNNNVFFITESKYQGKKEGFANVVITVIDLNSEDNTSRTNAQFKKESIIADYNLLNSDANNAIAVTKKKKDVHEKDDLEDHVFLYDQNSQMGKLEKTFLKMNNKNLFSQPVLIEYADPKKSGYTELLFIRLRKTLNLLDSHSETLTQYKAEIAKKDLVTDSAEFSALKSAVVQKTQYLNNHMQKKHFDWNYIRSDELNPFYAEILTKITAATIDAILTLKVFKKRTSGLISGFFDFLLFLEDANIDDEAFKHEKEILAMLLFDLQTSIIQNITVYSRHFRRKNIIEQSNFTKYLIDFFNKNENSDVVEKLEHILNFYNIFLQAMKDNDITLHDIMKEHNIAA